MDNNHQPFTPVGHHNQQHAFMSSHQPHQIDPTQQRAPSMNSYYATPSGFCPPPLTSVNQYTPPDLPDTMSTNRPQLSQIFANGPSSSPLSHVPSHIGTDQYMQVHQYRQQHQQSHQQEQQVTRSKQYPQLQPIQQQGQTMYYQNYQMSPLSYLSPVGSQMQQQQQFPQRQHQMLTPPPSAVQQSANQYTALPLPLSQPLQLQTPSTADSMHDFGTKDGQRRLSSDQLGITNSASYYTPITSLGSGGLSMPSSLPSSLPSALTLPSYSQDSPAVNTSLLPAAFNSKPSRTDSHSMSLNLLGENSSLIAQSSATGRGSTQSLESFSTKSKSRPLTGTNSAINANSPTTIDLACSGNNPHAAPGPIPATTPTVVRQDRNGVHWIAFEYSKDRVKTKYTIRCDVEAVNTEKLDRMFKEANCVYPRAYCDKDQYTGNRFAYESDCNTVGWSLAELNPCLRDKRGLIQRAVDSWRNSNSDSRLRSRRVRRLNKANVRKANSASTSATTANGSKGMGMGGGITNITKEFKQSQRELQLQRQLPEDSQSARTSTLPSHAIGAIGSSASEQNATIKTEEPIHHGRSSPLDGYVNYSKKSHAGHLGDDSAGQNQQHSHDSLAGSHLSQERRPLINSKPYACGSNTGNLDASRHSVTDSGNASMDSTGALGRSHHINGTTSNSHSADVTSGISDPNPTTNQLRTSHSFHGYPPSFTIGGSGSTPASHHPDVNNNLMSPVSFMPPVLLPSHDTDTETNPATPAAPSASSSGATSMNLGQSLSAQMPGISRLTSCRPASAQPQFRV